jgi:phosphoenolpyruvate carboxykinase (ATP)
MKSSYDISRNGIIGASAEFWNLHTPALYEHAIRNREGNIAHLGPLVVRTGSHTGRSPNDKFIVRDANTENTVWWGNNKSFTQEAFERIQSRIQAYFMQRDVYVQDLYAGADPRYRLKVRFITQYAWHSLFVRTMFILPKPEELADFEPDFTVIDAPGFHATPEVDSTLSPTFILLNITKQLVLIGGTEYAGEMKKSIFSVMNYLLPQQGVLSMHCSANYGKDKDDVALFFGLSGTGKTTLSADPNRTLIGDDEHGWSDEGVFNFEGGSYAKVIRLSQTGEPEIYATTRRFATVLENVAMDPETRFLDLNSELYTENTRAAYPIKQIPNADISGVAGHPNNVIFLTADAFGVMPPVARLSTEQAMYHFISGYTAKVAGTERGVTEPSATFSACFGAPFMTLHPKEYANLLRKKLNTHGSDVWLINTGWTGGPYGVGQRISIKDTRAIVTAVLNGSLKDVEYRTDPVFGFKVPTSVPGVDSTILQPRNTWEDKDAYDRKYHDLAERFIKNFAKYEDEAPELVAAGPKV